MNTKRYNTFLKRWMPFHVGAIPRLWNKRKLTQTLIRIKIFLKLTIYYYLYPI